MVYASVTVEGGMFPADLLDRIAGGEGEGQRSADFGLGAGRRVTDETQGAFSEVRSYWQAFQYRLKRSTDSTTTLTRENWVIPLLQALGFERVEFQRAAATVGGESYAISHRAGTTPDATVVHIVALDQRLDARDGRRSPHALVQEYLNRSDAVWAIVTNGQQLRVLRDTARLAKPTYLEFNLEAMVEANLYSEFVLLYRLIHVSRFPAAGAAGHECLLERYYQQGIEEGGKVREKLRGGVVEALNVLGSAFLSHLGSHALRARLEDGTIDAAAYYRQLLRLVYRLLFLMAAEERKLIFSADTPAANQAVYDKYYSVARLRDRCERRFGEDRHSDLWLGLRQTFQLFREDILAAKLGLHALNGELFGPDACADLENAGCANRDLLAAMYRLSTYLDDGVRRRVNYAFLDVEEFGSVYESLLDFHPRVTLAPPAFELAAGSERKQTSSYYTPPELVRELIESALVPVMEERLAEAKTREAKEQALLNLRVLDPASGSGHFLLAAARRIGRELARVRSGENEPAPERHREAVRDVIRHCVYAVDKNPLAVDLCKVALWIEGHSPGLPLSFLDHHVKCGDSLVGVFDLKALADGIPDDAYKPVTGDDKSAATGYRKRNREERAGQLGLGDAIDPLPSALADDFAALAELDDRTPQDVQAKEWRYESLRKDERWWTLKVACDLWTAAFFAPLTPSAPGQDTVPTTRAVRRALRQPNALDGRMVGEAQGLGARLRFFHWPLEFPDVMTRLGFDVIVGNPPFSGGRKITENLGESYAAFLGAAFSESTSAADMCSYFFRRAFDLLCDAGHLGMVATNTIGQGDTRQSGLAVILRRDGTITFARRFYKWPGVANVEVNLVSIRRGPWREPRQLDGRAVSTISSHLDDEEDIEPSRIQENRRKAFQGSILLGTGFILDSERARALTASHGRNKECLRPYITGEDINSRPDQSASRWVINFGERSDEEARSFSDLWSIVEAKVRPERIQKDARKYPRMVNEWWKFWNNRQELIAAIEPLARVLARSRVSELHMLAFVPSNVVFSDATVIFASDDDYHFALLQSNVHEAWVRRYASTMRTDIRYTPTDCFETFPFPQEPAREHCEWAARVGAEYHEHRRQTMLARNLGLTKTYNLFHKPDYNDEDIVRLRELHTEMDRAILACYSWADLDPGHGFHQNERGQTRYTISADARREVLRRLQELNLQIAEAEAAGAQVSTIRPQTRERRAGTPRGTV